MKRLKLLLLIIIALFFASCHKYNGPDEVPQKYIDIFPYHLGQKLVFNSLDKNITLEIVLYNVVMDNACYGSSWSAFIEVAFDSEYFNNNRRGGLLEVSNEHDYGNLMFYHYYGENVSFKEDTIIIYDYQSNECAKIVKYKGIIEFEDNGETWTLIE